MATNSSLKTPAEMSFAEFAESVKPSGAVNRFPSIGVGVDVYSYSVYMNGPLAAELPEHSREHAFKDVTLHALTEKLQLDSGSARDNLKVAELVALRGSWMSAVLEASVGRATPLAEQISEDYALLTKGMTHPWITSELKTQRALSSKLQSVLARAAVATSEKLKDVIPKETSIGRVVAQDLDFTVQRTNEGEIVAHENRRLNAMPVMDSEIMVAYYRGIGQVVNSLQNVKVSPPFVDAISGDLAVVLEDGKGVEQVVLFNSLASFDMFVKAHGVESDLVRQAMDARQASPKAITPVPERELVKTPYVDAKSGCLAVDYKEGGVVYSALFRNAREMMSVANQFDLGAKAIAASQALEASRWGGSTVAEIEVLNQVEERVSESELFADLERLGYQDIQQQLDGVSYLGKVVAMSPLHVAQHIGRGTVVIHDLRALDKAAALGDVLTVKFDKGRGLVTDMVKADKDLGR